MTNTGSPQKGNWFYHLAGMGMLVSILFCSTFCNEPADPPPIEPPFPGYSKEGDAVQKELDEIYTLLAYALVYQDWQPDSIPRERRRGYNIGTILVDEKQQVVHWGLNSINSTDNATQHGEVRAITSYLDSLRAFNLRGFTLYTTLEPCAMCSGMAVMTNIDRVVYGQKDVDFAGALDRLAVNSEKFGGFKPYPRIVVPDPAPTPFRERLDEKFREFLASDDEKYLAKFLASEEARQIFGEASKAFAVYQVTHSVNADKYQAAKAFLDAVAY